MGKYNWNTTCSTERTCNDGESSVHSGTSESCEDSGVSGPKRTKCTFDAKSRTGAGGGENIFAQEKMELLQDGPGIEEYSQHTQVFAVLTDTVAGEQAKENLRKTILYKEKYSQCSVAMVYYLFRALEKTGMYELTESYWNIWQRMIDKYTTTCVEDEVQERSECHAWGALILYELPSVILGIRPSAPGYEKMEVKPVPGYLKSARGQVITPKGMVNVEW